MIWSRQFRFHFNEFLSGPSLYTSWLNISTITESHPQSRRRPIRRKIISVKLMFCLPKISSTTFGCWLCFTAQTGRLGQDLRQLFLPLRTFLMVSLWSCRPAFSTAIGPPTTRLGSHWSRGS